MAQRETFILFHVAENTFAIPSMQVQQMEMIEQITRVPNAPGFVDGIVAVRGQIVPVVNVRRRFGLEARPYDLRSRLIVTQVNSRVVGLAVDEAREFFAFDPQQILPPPDSLVTNGAAFIRGVVSLENRLVFLLDLEKMFTLDEITTEV